MGLYITDPRAGIICISLTQEPERKVIYKFKAAVYDGLFEHGRQELHENYTHSGKGWESTVMGASRQ